MSLIKKIDWLSRSANLNLQQLVDTAGLRPDCDFRGCDFRDVNFDGFTAPIVDLSHCDLRGAKIDGIFGKVIFDNAKVDKQTILPSFRPFEENSAASRLEQFLRFVDNFHIPTYVPEGVAQHIREERLVYGGYNSAVEQDITLSDLEGLIRQQSSVDDMRPQGVNIVKFTSHEMSQSTKRLGAEECDKLFENLFGADHQAFASLVSNVSGLEIFTTDPPGPRPTLPPPRRESALRSLPPVLGVQYNDRTLAAKIADTIRYSSYEYRNAPTYAVFSGFPPISDRLWMSIRKKYNKIRMVILCPTSMLAVVAADRHRKEKIMFARGPIVIPRDRLSSDDLIGFLNRLQRFQRMGVFCSDEAVEEIMSCDGEPLVVLKNVMGNRIHAEDFLTNGRMVI